MRMSDFHAILFDFGGVIAEKGFDNGLINQAEKQALDARSMPQAGLDAMYDSGFITGQGSAADFWALMRRRSGLQGDDDFLTARILDGFQLRKAMLQLVNELRKRGYITALLSDQTIWLDELDTFDHFFQHFDHLFISYRLGKGKRDPSIFSDVAKQLKLMPAQLLFIDDNPDYVAGARKMGLSAILYVDYHHFVITLEQMLGENFQPVSV